jgi:DNA-binding transcriptional LysR family regulator
MARPDLNLLVTLDVLLAEGSVARAAKRLQLSPSAMSRTLTRLRETTGDPLLVRAGRRLVSTPRAQELRARVGQVVTEAEALLQPAKGVNIEQMARSFTLRTSEGFVETFGPALLARVNSQAPRVKLRFVQKSDKDSEPLREGRVDLETGVVEGRTGPEIRAQALFWDRWVGVIRAKHALSEGRITVARYASGKHINVWRGPGPGPIDDALALLGLEREVVASLAGGFATAVALARCSDLIAAVPELHTARLREGMHSFALPVSTSDFTVSLLWHPRVEADLAHRWLRECVREVCASEVGRFSGRRVAGRRTTRTD